MMSSIQYYKCGACGYFFLSKQYLPNCPKCKVTIHMTTRDQIEANMRKERYLKKDIILFNGFDKTETLYYRSCIACFEGFYTENPENDMCLLCRR